MAKFYIFHCSSVSVRGARFLVNSNEFLWLIHILSSSSRGFQKCRSLWIKIKHIDAQRLLKLGKFELFLAVFVNRVITFTWEIKANQECVLHGLSFDNLGLLVKRSQFHYWYQATEIGKMIFSKVRAFHGLICDHERNVWNDDALLFTSRQSWQIEFCSGQFF